MYGSIFKMKALPGKGDEVVRVFKEWARDVRPGIEGVNAGHLLRLDSDPDSLIGVAMFSDEKTYRANAERPGQDAWYQSLRSLLSADPEWNDGEYVVTD